MRPKVLALLALGAVLLMTPAFAATQASPGDGGFRLSLGYDGMFLVKVLDIKIDERATAQGFDVSARLTSTGVLAVIKHIDEVASSRGRVVDGDPRPGTFEYQHLSGKTHRKARTTWMGADVVTTSTPPFAGLGDPPASLEQKLRASDPLTTILRLSLVGSRDALCRRTYLFFDGKQLYGLEFSNPRAAGPTAQETSLGLANPFRCDARYRQIAGYARSAKPKKESGEARPMEVDFAEVGAGGPWVMSRLRASTPLGAATVELRRLTMSGRAPS